MWPWALLRAPTQLPVACAAAKFASLQHGGQPRQAAKLGSPQRATAAPEHCPRLRACVQRPARPPLAAAAAVVRPPPRAAAVAAAALVTASSAAGPGPPPPRAALASMPRPRPSLAPAVAAVAGGAAASAAGAAAALAAGASTRGTTAPAAGERTGGWRGDGADAAQLSDAAQLWAVRGKALRLLLLCCVLGVAGLCRRACGPLAQLHPPQLLLGRAVCGARDGVALMQHCRPGPGSVLSAARRNIAPYTLPVPLFCVDAATRLRSAAAAAAATGAPRPRARSEFYSVVASQSPPAQLQLHQSSGQRGGCNSFRKGSSAGDCSQGQHRQGPRRGGGQQRAGREEPVFGGWSSGGLRGTRSSTHSQESRIPLSTARHQGGWPCESPLALLWPSCPAFLSKLLPCLPVAGARRWRRRPLRTARRAPPPPRWPRPPRRCPRSPRRRRRCAGALPLPLQSLESIYEMS